jgi:hypothetical protein
MMDTDLDLLFNPGNIINCTTCFDQKLEGEVVAFDYLQRIIVLKTQSSVQPNHHDVILLNLKAVGDVKVISEAKKEDISSKPINIPKVRFLTHYFFSRFLTSSFSLNSSTRELERQSLKEKHWNEHSNLELLKMDSNFS